MAHGIDTALDGAEERDYNFVCNALKGKPRHTALVASWLRDGELDAALRRRDLRGIQLVLGPSLPAKCKKMRHLPPRVLRRLFYQAVGAVDECYEPEGTDALDYATQIQPIMLWALLCELDTPVPCTHVHHQYEEPLVAVLWERYVVCGSLLDGVTYETLATHTGWYFYDPKKPLEVVVRMKDEVLTVKLPDNEELLKGYRLSVVDNYQLTTASLQDEDEGYIRNLYKLLSKQHANQKFAQTDEAFEYPDAAEGFSALDVEKASDIEVKPPLEWAAPVPKAKCRPKSRAKARGSVAAATAGPPSVPPADVPAGRPPS